VPSPPLAGPLRVDYTEAPVAGGEHDGTRAGPAGLTLEQLRGVREYVDPFASGPASTPRRFGHASWTSAPVEPGFVFTELVPTWHAQTPGASWVEISARVRVHPAGAWSRWLPVARWADHDSTVHPTSVADGAPGAGGTDGLRVDADTVRISGGADAWQLRITLLCGEVDGGGGGRGDGGGGCRLGPTVSYLGAMASTTPSAGPPSPPGAAAGRALELPALSQRIHSGRLAQWGGGGDVWCSPTCVSMVLGFWQAGPDPDAMAWVDPAYPDRAVYHAVRHTWDYAYQGAGNWSFNVAYAARFGLRGFVTRLRDLTEAETFIAAGIPLVASVVVDPRRLDGADYTSAGHLVVIAGFTADGDVIVHDPAAWDPNRVRRVYRRGQFEHAWQAGSGGIVYIIHTPAVALPPRSTYRNW
jgi:hypothetical protein